MSILTPFSEHQEHLNSHIGAYLFNRSFTQKTIAALLVVSIALASYYALNSKLDTLHVHAASTDPRTATSTSDCVNDASTGTQAWSNPGNAAAVGSGVASITTSSSSTTQYLKCTNFNFVDLIPDGNVISGIELTAGKGRSGFLGIQDNAVRIIKGGVIGATDKSSGTGWPSSISPITYGGPTDLWGETWTISDIESSGFGIAISASITAVFGSGGPEIDYLQLTVYYGAPPPTLDQSAYRIYSNTDSADVGAPLAALNTPATLSSTGQDFRLRTLVHAGINSWETGGDLKLQYVDPGSGSCNAPSGGTPETWTDIMSNAIAAQWTEVTPITGGTTSSWGKLAYLDGTFFLYTNSRFYTSTDGATWTTGSVPPSIVNRTAIAVFDDKVWVLGGGGSSTSNAVYYTTDGTNYTQATAAADWIARTDHEAVVFDSKIWVVGGQDGDGNSLNDVWYSSDGASWTQATAGASWAARREIGLAVHDNKLWLAGGRNSSGVLYDDVWSSSDGATWTQATASAPWGERRGLGLVAVDDRLVLLGGGINNNGDSGQSDVWVSTDGVDWELSTSSPGWSGRLYPGVTVVDGEIWMTSGASGLKDVWHTTSSTLIAFSNNDTPTSGTTLTTNVNDPTHSSDTVVAQTYTEDNPVSVTAEVLAGQDALWDFSLIDNGAPAATTYCFRMLHTANETEFDTYTHYPTITTFSGAAPTPQMHQRLRGGNWWNGGVRQFLILD